jgi:hypothetical protein
MSAPTFTGHEFMTFGSAWIKPVDIKTAKIWRVLAVAKVEVLKELKQPGAAQ